MTPRTRALIALASAAFVGCVQRSSLKPPAEDERVVRLTNDQPLAYRMAAGITRPSLEIASGGGAEWNLPAGPPRKLRTAFVRRAQHGRITAILEFPEKRPTVLAAMATTGPDEWEDWDFAVPEIPKRARLRISFRDLPGSDPLVVAQPTLSRSAARSPRILILFDVDTLREDHLSLYGYARRTTPNIDRYFKRGSVWKNAFSNVPWTLPSHVTMFSSTLPNEHGVGERADTIPPEIPVLAEQIQQAGYRTIAITNGGYMDPSWGFDRGFDSYSATVDEVQQEVDNAEALLSRYAGEPIFLFLHTYQIHNYIPPGGAGREFLGSTRDLGPLWKQNPYFTLRYLAAKYPFARVRSWLINRYDAAIFGVDKAFGSLDRWLDLRDLSRRTAILLTSDHGEEIFDRPYDSPDPFAHFSHGMPYLYREYLKVPFALRAPWRTSYADGLDENVSLVDLAPTVLDVLDLPAPGSFRGRSLLRAENSRETIFSKGPRYDALSVQIGNHKMIRRTEAVIRSPQAEVQFGRLPSHECYDTSSDPWEIHPIPCEGPWFEGLRLEAERYLAHQFPGSVVFRIATTDPDGAGEDYALEARERSGSIRASSFGLENEARFWKSGKTLFGRFRVGKSPVWVALRPRILHDAMDIKIFANKDVIVQSPPLEKDAEGVFSWSSLGWRGRKALPLPISVFTTAPAASTSTRPAPARVLQRLRSLGYLASGGDPPGMDGDADRDGPVTKIASFPVPDGMIRIDQPTSLPGWVAPAEALPRRIDRLVPPETTVQSGPGLTSRGDFVLDVFGDNFRKGDWIFWEADLATTTFIDSGHLRAVIPPDHLQFVMDVAITIRNPLEPNMDRAQAKFRILPESTTRQLVH